MKHQQKQPKEGMVYLGSQYKDATHHGEEAWQQKEVTVSSARMQRQVLVLSSISHLYLVQDPTSWNGATHF